MYVYPRLSRPAAKLRLTEVRLTAENDPDKLGSLVVYGDSRATLPATGGTSASADRLVEIRESVLEQLAPWHGRVVGRGVASQFDRALGQSLFTELDIVASQAAEEDMWSFLTLLVFPDVAYQRFPDLHEERLLGLPRNVLRRAWVRYSVLGDLLFRGAVPLQEDELVGLFERSALARNPRLLRSLASQILDYAGRNRTAYARLLMKEATISTGPLLLDIMDDASLAAHLKECAKRIRTE